MELANLTEKEAKQYVIDKKLSSEQEKAFWNEWYSNRKNKSAVEAAQSIFDGEQSTELIVKKKRGRKPSGIPKVIKLACLVKGSRGRKAESTVVDLNHLNTIEEKRELVKEKIMTEFGSMSLSEKIVCVVNQNRSGCVRVDVLDITSGKKAMFNENKGKIYFTLIKNYEKYLK